MSVSLSEVGANTEPSAETRVRPTCSRTLRQFRLEQDDQGDGTDLKDILHQEADAPQLEDVCRQIDSHQCQQALDKLDCPGFPGAA